jgi:electron transport complex protein RnfD
MLIRLWGTMPEGVTFGILIMNAVTPIIDNFTVPQQFGGVKKDA